MRKDSVSLKHAVVGEVLGTPHRPLGWKPNPSGCVYICQRLREGSLALGEAGADWASSVKLVHGVEALVPCNALLLGVKTDSLLTGLSVACGATSSS